MDRPGGVKNHWAHTAIAPWTDHGPWSSPHGFGLSNRQGWPAASWMVTMADDGTSSACICCTVLTAWLTLVPLLCVTQLHSPGAAAPQVLARYQCLSGVTTLPIWSRLSSKFLSWNGVPYTQ